MAGLYGRGGRKVQGTWALERPLGRPPAAGPCGSADSGDAHLSARAEAEARAVANLTGEVESMVRALRLALAEGRAAGTLP